MYPVCDALKPATPAAAVTADQTINPDLNLGINQDIKKIDTSISKTKKNPCAYQPVAHRSVCSSARMQSNLWLIAPYAHRPVCRTTCMHINLYAHQTVCTSTGSKHLGIHSNPCHPYLGNGLYWFCRFFECFRFFERFRFYWFSRFFDFFVFSRPSKLSKSRKRYPSRIIFSTNRGKSSSRNSRRFSSSTFSAASSAAK